MAHPPTYSGTGTWICPLCRERVPVQIEEFTTAADIYLHIWSTHPGDGMDAR